MSKHKRGLGLNLGKRWADIGAGRALDHGLNGGGVAKHQQGPKPGCGEIKVIRRAFWRAGTRRQQTAGHGAGRWGQGAFAKLGQDFARHLSAATAPDIGAKPGISRAG